MIPPRPPEGHPRRMSRQRIFAAAVGLCVALGIHACGEGTTDPPPPPPAPPRATTVTVTPATAELTALGATAQFTAEVRDQRGQPMAGAAVAWSSSDSTVATVDNAGLVTAAGNGQATLTATSGQASSGAQITVEQSVASVEVTPPADTLVSRDTLRVIASAVDANGHAVADADFEWSSSDTLVASVDSTGLVTAASPGEAVITATTAAVAGTAQLVVSAPAPTVVRVAPDTVVLTALGQTAQLVAEVFDQIGRTMEEVPLSWTSADTTVAAVDSAGVLTAVGGGVTTVAARAGDASGAAVVSVMQSADSVVMSPAVDTVAVGDTLRLVAEALDANGHRIADASFAWSSSDESVATVDDAGLVRGRSEGAATITAATGAVGGTALIMIAAPNRGPVAIDTIPAQTVPVGEASQVDVAPYFTDPEGDALVYAAASSNDAAVSVSVAGSVLSLEAITRGTAVVTVTATDPGGLSARQAFDIKARDRSTPTILRIDPLVLVEGETATISGWGFSPSRQANDVFVGGHRAPVLSSTATRLSVTVPRANCLPPREVLLWVSTAGGRDSAAIGSTPLSEEDRNWPRFEWRHTSSGDGCIHLPGIPEGGEFLIGVTSVSEDPAHLAPVTLVGTPGDASILGAYDGPAVPRADRVAYSRHAAPLVSSSGRVGPPPFISGGGPQKVPGGLELPGAGRFVGHAEAMARNQALIGELGRPEWSAASSGDGATRSSLIRGDTVTLNTSPNTRVEAVVRLVGDHTVWLDDVANPAGTFPDAELMELDAFYSSHVNPVNDAYYGSLSDVDGNGRILVLMTVEVNRGGGGAGVTPCDLYSRSRCAYSNEAEIFYAFVPDPEGVAGNPTPKEFVLRWYPMLLTHEVTHLVQYAETLFIGLPRKRAWELEGGARMAEELVGYRLFGHASGQDLGYAEWSAAQWDWFHWLGGLFDFFSGGRGAPEECSWLTYLRREGNDGPCGGPYGVPLVMHRFAMDRWGHSYPGGERALLKRLTQSPLQGFASLVDVSPGWSIERILGEFYAALWLEGTAGRATLGMTSWDIHDVVSRFDASRWLRPHSSSSSSPSVSVRIRGGSSMYFHWTPDGPLRPTSFKVEPAGDGPVFVWAIRAR